MKHLNVVAALIKFGDEYLCMQRNTSKHDYISYKYEFPGGKIEEGEAHKDALARELVEEMNMKVEIGDLFCVVNHTYADFEITMNVYSCIASSKDFELKEHKSFVWLKKENMLSLDWAAADIPAVQKLLEN